MSCGLTIVLIILILAFLIPASYILGITRGLASSASGFKVQCPNCANAKLCGLDHGAFAGQLRVFCDMGAGETH